MESSPNTKIFELSLCNTYFGMINPVLWPFTFLPLCRLRNCMKLATVNFYVSPWSKIKNLYWPIKNVSHLIVPVIMSNPREGPWMCLCPYTHSGHGFTVFDGAASKNTLPWVDRCITFILSCHKYCDSSWSWNIDGTLRTCKNMSS